MIELPPDKRMDVKCPIPASYLDTIRPMDSAVSSELDRIRAAAQQAQADGWEKMILTLCRRRTQAWAARILASLPGLLDLADQLGGIKNLAFS
jgi:hypothetical protein